MFFLIGFATVTDSNSTPISNSTSTPYIQEYTQESERTFEFVHELKSDSTISLTGIVTDDNNEHLPGVSVVFKGTTIGTETDLDGKFILEIDSKKITQNSTLVFSYVGFMTTEVELGKKFEGLKVILGPDVVWLGEIRIPWYKRLWWTITSPFRKGY